MGWLVLERSFYWWLCLADFGEPRAAVGGAQGAVTEGTTLPGEAPGATRWLHLRGALAKLFKQETVRVGVLNVDGVEHQFGGLLRRIVAFRVLHFGIRLAPLALLPSSLEGFVWYPFFFPYFFKLSPCFFGIVDCIWANSVAFMRTSWTNTNAFYSHKVGDLCCVLCARIGRIPTRFTRTNWANSLNEHEFMWRLKHMSGAEECRVNSPLAQINSYFSFKGIFQFDSCVIVHRKIWNSNFIFVVI